jgi:hypothetical protein
MGTLVHFRLMRHANEAKDTQTDPRKDMKGMACELMEDLDL